MRYLCLAYGTEDSLPVVQHPNPTSRAEVDALTRDSLAYDDMLRTSGHFILAHALHSARTATEANRHQHNLPGAANAAVRPASGNRQSLQQIANLLQRNGVGSSKH